MHIKNNVSLATYTSFGVGGPAQFFTQVSTADELIEALRCTTVDMPLHIIGYGSNSLISDKGLDGMTICVRGGAINVDGSTVIADAGAWWDDIVTTAIEHELWGIELLSEVPGSLGAALFINIAAYGQSIGESVTWVDIWDRRSDAVTRLTEKDLKWDYKTSLFQSDEAKNWVIIRACLSLSKEPTTTLSYQKALDIATEKSLDTNSLLDRRTIIIEARRQAGSLWHPNDNKNHTVGSFFRNPVVSNKQATYIMSFDESGKSTEEIRKMNKVHGGNEMRISAAHVMLAAGFKRNQRWGNVKLNEHNLLKIEALPNATAQEIFDVATHIQRTCKEKLDVTLIAEARILGEFTA